MENICLCDAAAPDDDDEVASHRWLVGWLGGWLGPGPGPGLCVKIRLIIESLHCTGAGRQLHGSTILIGVELVGSKGVTGGAGRKKR